MLAWRVGCRSILLEIPNWEFLIVQLIYKGVKDFHICSCCEIHSFFGDRFISKGLQPPHSPDLTPPHYFLWIYLKARVYQSKPRTIDALKANITEEIQAVTAETYWQGLSPHMARRAQSYLDANGGHFPAHVMMSSHFPHNERTPVQISLQYLHLC